MDLWRARELLVMLTWRDIHIKYKQSVMGFLWAILMPGLIVAAGAIIRVGVANWSGKSVDIRDIESVMVRAVLWAFIVGGVRFGTNSLTGNTNLVSKIAFPKETFPLAAVISNLVDFGVSLSALFVVLLILGWHPSVHILYFIPLLLVVVMFTSGLALLLSAANLFFRDVKYLVEIFLTYAIFFTPVLYEAEMLGKWQKTVMFNPFSPLLEGVSRVVIDHRTPDFLWTLYSAAASMFFLVVGYVYFKKLEARFAESI